MISLSLYNKKTNGEQGLFQLKQKKHTQTLVFYVGPREWMMQHRNNRIRIQIFVTIKHIYWIAQPIEYLLGVSNDFHCKLFFSQILEHLSKVYALLFTLVLPSEAA